MSNLDAIWLKYPIITYYYGQSLTNYALSIRSYWIKHKAVNVYRVINVTGNTPQWKNYDDNKSDLQTYEKMASNK